MAEVCPLLSAFLVGILICLIGCLCTDKIHLAFYSKLAYQNMYNVVYLVGAIIKAAKGDSVAIVDASDAELQCTLASC